MGYRLVNARSAGLQLTHMRQVSYHLTNDIVPSLAYLTNHYHSNRLTRLAIRVGISIHLTAGFLLPQILSLCIVPIPLTYVQLIY